MLTQHEGSNQYHTIFTDIKTLGVLFWIVADDGSFRNDGAFVDNAAIQLTMSVDRYIG